MKLGILLCDHVQQQLQTEFGDYPEMFRSILLQADPSLEIVMYDVVDGIFPTSIDDCDVYLSSGSKFSVNEPLDWIARLLDFIKLLYGAEKGFIGICFGHQLIAKALGGRVEKSLQGWGVGVSKAKIIKSHAWMAPYQTDLNLIVSHQEQIVNLPENSQVLLSNEFCPYSMILLESHFLGLQGHPEFSTDYSFALMNSRRDRIPADRIVQGERSLQNETNALLATKWILNFLRQTLTIKTDSA